jgi:hypothetical protein
MEGIENFLQSINLDKAQSRKPIQLTFYGKSFPILIMGKRKTYAMALVALTITFAALVPLKTDAEITNYYSNNADTNYVGLTLTINSPNNQTYNREMPLNFNVYWDRYPTFSGLPTPPAPVMVGEYSYSIDDTPIVTITSNESSSDHYDPRGFKVNPTFAYQLNVSGLSAGAHTIVITASIHGNVGHISFNASSPVVFYTLKTSPSPTPSPTVPELSWLVLRL